jgi:hypothetical protein
MTPEYLRSSAYYDLTELSIVPIGADPSAVAERQRRALAHYGHQLVDLFDAQERPDSDAMAPDVRAAVIAECHRLGIPLAEDRPQRTPRRPDINNRLVRESELPELLRSLGVTTTVPAPAGEPPAIAGVDRADGDLILAAFTTLRGDS